MRKKVLFVVDSLTCGGAEKSLVSILQLLDRDKFDVDLLMITQGLMFDSYVPSYVNVAPIHNYAGFGKIWTIICRLCYSVMLRVFALVRVKRNLAELNWSIRQSSFVPASKHYDVAIGFQQGFSTYYVAKKVKASKKIAWINVDLKEEGFRESYNRPFYDKMDHIVAVSDVLCKMLKKTTYVDANKLCTIYDILDPDVIRRLAKEKGFEDVLPKNTWRIVTVGRVVAQKNYTLAVETAKILKERGLQFRWYFIGDGIEYDIINGLIYCYGLQNEVKLMGVKENPYPYMAECDIFVQTSRYEGYGLTLCEARILHKPEVCTDFPVVHNQIRDGVNGLIADLTPQSVSEKILMLVNDNKLRERLISATYDEVYQTKLTEIKKISALLAE